jgi:hypothetical protein
MSDHHIQLNHVTIREKDGEPIFGYVLSNCADPRFQRADVIEVHDLGLDALRRIEANIPVAKAKGKRLVVLNDYTYEKEVQTFIRRDGTPGTSNVVKIKLEGDDPVFGLIDGPRPLGCGNLDEIEANLGVDAVEESDDF